MVWTWVWLQEALNLLLWWGWYRILRILTYGVGIKIKQWPFRENKSIYWKDQPNEWCASEQQEWHHVVSECVNNLYLLWLCGCSLTPGFCSLPLDSLSCHGLHWSCCHWYHQRRGAWCPSSLLLEVITKMASTRMHQQGTREANIRPENGSTHLFRNAI